MVEAEVNGLMCVRWMVLFSILCEGPTILYVRYKANVRL